MNFIRIMFILCIVSAFVPIGVFSLNKETCPPLPYISLPHGEILVTSTTTIRFQCNPGYFVAGPLQIRCRRGKWTSVRKPICLKVEGRCDSPPAISNADIFGDNLEVGSSIQYMCHPGYLIIGEGRRLCLQSRGWSGITPACLNETEPLQDVAARLEENFLNKINAHSSDSVVQARYLDTQSLLKGLELVILVDRSSSVDPFDLEKGKDFIKFLFRRFKIRNIDNQIGTRAAVIAFGSKVDMIFNVNDALVVNSEAACQILDEKLQPGGGGTAMVPAFIDVYQNVEPLLRQNAKRALFLLSDGDPNVGGMDADAISDNLKEFAGFEVFTVGIGRDVNRHLLSRIASEPVIDHVFLLDNYNNLEEILTMIKNEPVEVPPPPPDRCGLPTEYMYLDTRPWNAAIYVSHFIKTENVTKLRLCGGALICSEWVLTAAACFYYVDKEHVNLQLQEVFVVLGENHPFVRDPKEANFYAKDVKIYHHFDPKKDLYNNLALIQLNAPAPEKEFRPVCLPYTTGVIPLHLDPELNNTLKAWGLSASKHGIETITPTTTRTRSKMKRILMAEDNECKRNIGRKIQGRSIFCASSGLDSCLGNIGSPVVGQDPKSGLHHILGVLSQRKECANGFIPYTELTKFIPWINTESERCHFKHWNTS